MSESGVPGNVLSVVENQSTDTAPRKMVLNMGPQHPSTHGVLRLLMELDGENIVSCRPDIGYLHTGIEKEFEVKTYQQAVTLTIAVRNVAAAKVVDESGDLNEETATFTVKYRTLVKEAEDV